MKFKITFVALLTCTCVVRFTKTDMSGFIVNGKLSVIEYYPYVAFVSKTCSGQTSSCGASIVNQALLLTAAHCVEKCRGDFEIKAYTGSVRKFDGLGTKVVDFRMHEQYNRTSYANDIALLKLESDLKFGTKVKRVALVKTPPKYYSAIVAGWGWIDAVGTRGDLLKYARQQVINHTDCAEMLYRIPVGTICGKDENGLSYPEKGDSGSALIANNFVQIGLVSFKKRSFTNHTVVYTDVSYFYDWIMINTEEMICQQ